MTMQFNGSFFESGLDYINLAHETDANTDFVTDYIKMTNYQRVLILVKKLGAEDVDTLGFAFVQATSAAGAGVKALEVSRYWTKVGVQTATGLWVAGTLTTPDDVIGIGSAVTTLPSVSTQVVADVDTAAAIVAVDIMATDLDINNGFKWLAVSVEGDEVNNAALISIDAILMGARFAGPVPTNAIV
jgi:hypothetical protein